MKNNIKVENIDNTQDVGVRNSQTISVKSYGYSPYIGENDNWYEYNDRIKAYEDTGKSSKGQKGDTGQDGHTPVKGVDYFTQEDIESLNIPEKTSDLTNDSNFIADSNYIHTDNNYTTVEKEKLSSLIPVTQAEKDTWNSKGTYSKPANGIPKTDLESAVQISLGKADTALQEHQSLSNYVQKTDYASNGAHGVVKGGGSAYGIDGNTGLLFCYERTYQQYQDSTGVNSFISKGTLENVITGKGLIDNTDYATTNVGGVIRILDDYGTYMINGVLSARTKTYQQYQSSANQLFIGKGTLENVLNEKIGTIETILETLTTGTGV